MHLKTSTLALNRPNVPKTSTLAPDCPSETYRNRSTVRFRKGVAATKEPTSAVTRLVRGVAQAAALSWCPLAVDPGAFPGRGFHDLRVPRVGVAPAQELAGGQLFHFFLCHVAIRVEAGQEMTLSHETPFFSTESAAHTRWLQQGLLHASPARALAHLAPRLNNDLPCFWRLRLIPGWVQSR